jgi:hypothetical protein
LLAVCRLEGVDFVPCMDVVRRSWRWLLLLVALIVAGLPFLLLMSSSRKTTAPAITVPARVCPGYSVDTLDEHFPCDAIHLNSTAMLSASRRQAGRAVCRQFAEDFDSLAAVYPSQQWRLLLLRRNMMMEAPDCLNHPDIFDRFALLFLRRSVLGHLFLHIPRSAGTSICRAATASNLTVPLTLWTNCNAVPFPPWWYFSFEHLLQIVHAAAVMPCRRLEFLARAQQKRGTVVQAGFVGNERWLDWKDAEPLFCPNVAYSIALRDPRERQISMWNLKINHGRPADGHVVDYLVWALLRGQSLTAAGTDACQRLARFTPQQCHVEPAKRVLERFDYLLDVKDGNCTKHLWHFLGISFDKLAAINSRKDHSVQNGTIMGARAAQLEKLKVASALPLLDDQVMLYAQELRKLDCAFYRRMYESERYKRGMS